MDGRTLRIIGPGRAGLSLARALAGAGWVVAPPLGRGDDPTDAAAGVEVVVIATPDDVIARVAAAVRPVDGCVIVHLAGSLGLEVLAPHVARASIHPLVSLSDPDLGASRLAGGAWFAVAGDPVAGQIVVDLGGRAVVVADEHRAAYHAAACIASNHLVALLGQVERIAGPVGVPLEAYLDLARGSLDNVAALGPAAALTGPAARGDSATLTRHRAALDPSERAAYDALAAAAERLATARGSAAG